jgi:drug/metabolite transporter (DMT)-like permease
MSARGWLAFLAISLLWGIPYLFIRVAVDGGLPPLFLAWSRVTLAALLVGAMAWRAGVLPTVRGRLRWLLVYGAIEIAMPFPLIAAGERHVASSLAAIIVAAVPLIVTALTLRVAPRERVRGRRLAGLIAGFAGVIALVGIDVGRSGAALLGAGAILLAAAGFAIGLLVLDRHLRDLDPRAAMATALAFAAVALTPFAALSAGPRHPSSAALIALAVLVVPCTAGALLVYAILVAEAGAARAAVINYIVPLVAVGLGAGALGEHLGATAIAGLLLILSGSWFATDGRLPPRAERFLFRGARPPSGEPVDEPESRVEALRP